MEEAVARPRGIYLAELSGPGSGITWSPRLALISQIPSCLGRGSQCEQSLTNLGIKMSLSSGSSQWNFMTICLLLLFLS